MHMLSTTTLVRAAPILLLAGAARGQALPDEATLAREAATQIPRAAAAIAQAARQASHMRPEIPAVDQGSATSMPDPAAIARRYDAKPAPPSPALLIMVSFSMPVAALDKLAEQASKAGAPLVLRGAIDGSLAKTALAASAYIERYPGLQFNIDPMPFRRYGVDRVPTFILARPGKDPACTAECGLHAGVAGDVTLDYALEYFSRNQDGHLADFAERMRLALRGRQ